MAFQPVSPVAWAGRWGAGGGLNFTWPQPFRAAASSPAGPVSVSLSVPGGTGLLPQPFGALPCSLRSRERRREGRKGYITSSSVTCPPINDTAEDAVAIFGTSHPFIPPAGTIGAIPWLPGTSNKTPLVLERRQVSFSFLCFTVQGTLDVSWKRDNGQERSLILAS